MVAPHRVMHRVRRRRFPVTGGRLVKVGSETGPTGLGRGTGDRESQVAESGSIVSGVAGRFASALLELAEEERAVDQIERDLDRFAALLVESPDLQRLVKSPVFTADEQTRAITAILDKAGISGLAAKFLKLVATNRRLFAVSDMIRSYKALVAAKKGISRAEVTVAEQPSQAILDDLNVALKSISGGEVAVDLKIDPTIIGGLVVKLGSRMVDASLRTKLNSIRIAMKEVG
jgi:F-type H+-transporting ATPase subunit delta